MKGILDKLGDGDEDFGWEVLQPCHHLLRSCPVLGEQRHPTIRTYSLRTFDREPDRTEW